MGTNYYLIKDAKPTCAHCGHTPEPEKIHIGKSSVSWRFTFRGYPERGITTVADWVRVIESGGAIVNEYGDPVPTLQFWALVEAKQLGKASYDVAVGRQSATFDFIDHDFS